MIDNFFLAPPQEKKIDAVNEGKEGSRNGRIFNSHQLRRRREEKGVKRDSTEGKS